MAKYILLTLLDVILYGIIAITMVIAAGFFFVFNGLIELEAMIEERRRGLKEQLGIAWRKRKVKT